MWNISASAKEEMQGRVSTLKRDVERIQEEIASAERTAQSLAADLDRTKRLVREYEAILAS